jgi:hypothetical protein
MEMLIELIAPVADFVEERYGPAAAWLAGIVVLILVLALAFGIMVWMLR